MCFVRYCFLFLCLLIIRCHSLTCRSAGGPKESELKNIYTKCLKMQDGKNSSNVRGYNEQNPKEPRRNDWDRSRMENDDRKKNRNDEMHNDNSKKDNAEGRSTSNDMNSRNDRMGNNDRRNKGHDMISNPGDENNNHRLNSRDDFQNDQFGSEMSHYNGYYSSTQPSRRYKRERRTENSGKRSQYNPNAQRSYEDTSKRDEKNSSENNTNKTGDSKACALHCFLENLEMTRDDGLPDKYLVTHGLTKDVKNEDLRDFLQESIDECFQLMDNENTEEKCEFSKYLLMCLSEKGRANCDDWKDDLKFE